MADLNEDQISELKRKEFVYPLTASIWGFYGTLTAGLGVIAIESNRFSYAMHEIVTDFDRKVSLFVNKPCTSNLVDVCMHHASMGIACLVLAAGAAMLISSAYQGAAAFCSNRKLRQLEQNI